MGKKKDFLVIFLLQETKNSNLFDMKIPIYLTKTVLKRTSNAIFNMNGTGKLKLRLISAYIS